jgi:hypothetical protein
MANEEVIVFLSHESMGIPSGRPQEQKIKKQVHNTNI